jgi:hypothetical protein
MRANDVKIGGEYLAKISGQQVHVRIVAEKPSGGWSAINVPTGKKVLVPMARVIQSEVTNESATTSTTVGNLTVTEVPPATVETIGAQADKPARGRKSKTEKEPAPDTAKLSQLDAAVKVLGESMEPLTTKQMVEAMTAKNLWASPGGKTPHATLYSAILRELQNKGDASRFVKTDRGHFQLRNA